MPGLKLAPLWRTTAGSGCDAETAGQNQDRERQPPSSSGAAAAMDGSQETGVWEIAQTGLGAEAEKLDLALVAGLMLEVILETAGSPADSPAHRLLVKSQLQGTLVNHLAGRVTLSRFHRLLRQLDHWFPLYYTLINGASSGADPSGQGREGLVPGPASQVCRGVRERLLRTFIEEKVAGLLPRRPHRKLDPDRLREFLGRTQGAWFRLKDFEQHFGVDRKTAWEYLQKFLQAGLLRHNGRHSAAVRYALDPRFLVVRAEALEIQVTEALSGLPGNLAEPVSDLLIAAGGEALREADWHSRLNPARCREVLGRLQAAGILEAGQGGQGRSRLRLARRYLEEAP